MLTLSKKSTSSNYQTPTNSNHQSSTSPNKELLSTVNDNSTSWRLGKSRLSPISNPNNFFTGIRHRLGLFVLQCMILAFCSATAFAASKPNTPKASTSRAATHQVDTVTIWSQSMQKPIKNVVILPTEYDPNTPQDWPVVYLLHGFRGRYDTWINKTQPDLPAAASRMGEIIVCPDGGFSSWYWDSPIDSTMRYETYITQELIAAIDSLYQTRPSREGRAITGYSMGGHGALYLALRHSNIFGACGSMSGGVALLPFPKNWDIEKRIGPYQENPLRWEEYSVMGQLWRAVPFNDHSREVAGLPSVDPSSELQAGQLAIFIDCGTEDYFYNVNMRLHEELLYRNVPHEFIIRPGRHTHEYWRHAVEFHLLFFRDFFNRTAKQNQ